MANAIRARNDNLLNAWQRICQEDLYHFNQISGKGAPFLTSGDKAGTVYLQFERESIARALNQAVDRVANQLHYWPRPAWFTEVMPLSAANNIRAQSYTVRFRKLITFGQRAVTVIQAGAAVAYSDPNNIGINDTATIVVNTTVANDEIQLFFTVADGAYGAADARFQIETTTVTDNAGVVTITAPAAYFVKPSIWTTPYVLTNPNMRDPNAANTQTAADFVTTVDVYRVYNDTTDAIQLLSADGTVLQTFTGEILEPELGVFRLGGNWCNPTTWQGPPMRINVRYYSGEPLFNGEMDVDFAETLVSFANARMTERYTSFSRWTLDRWEKDNGPVVADGVNTGVMPILSQRAAKDPFMWGLRRGEIRASQMVIDRGIQQGGKLTRSARWGWWK